ncbi:MAG: hypothetical protein E6Q41_01690 [Cyclobacteriaceae bacterium]|nr:MAG: hypothetical protein E6Q41_01690 [Cyclobacteriaceae bacterium]
MRQILILQLVQCLKFGVSQMVLPPSSMISGFIRSRRPWLAMSTTNGVSCRIFWIITIYIPNMNMITWVGLKRRTVKPSSLERPMFQKWFISIIIKTNQDSMKAIYNFSTLFCLMILTVSTNLAQTINTTSSMGCAGVEVTFFIQGGSNCGAPRINSGSNWYVSPSTGVIIIPQGSGSPTFYNSARIKFSNPGSYTISASFGCFSSGATGTAYNSGFQVGVGGTPTISITTTNASACNRAVTFTSSRTLGGTTPTYKWFINGVEVVNQNASSFVANGLNHGDIVHASMQSSNLCESPLIVNSNSITVTKLTSTPIPSVQNLTFCDFERPVLTIPLSTNQSHFKWYTNSGTPLGEGREFVLPILKAGTYTYQARLFDSFGCQSTSLIPVNVTITSNCDNKLNRIETITKNHRKVSGSTVTSIASNTKAYFDLLGKPLQTQVRNLTENQVLSSAAAKDGFERPVLSTLSAPLNQTSFQYKHLFLTNQDGDKYDHQDINTPLGNHPGTVGWYYSNLNPDNQIPKTEFPFSVSDFYEDGSGDARMSGGPGLQLKLGSGHEMLSGTFPVVNELNDYLLVRNTHVLPGQTSYTTLKYEAIQQVVRDQQGRYAVSFSDKSGKAVMTARPGNWLNVTNTVTLKANDAVLKDRLYFYKLTDGPVTLTAANSPTYTIKNLVTNTAFAAPTNGTNWPAGFYLISLSGTGSGTLDVSYSNGYGDISYNFYDDAGRLVSTISPNGYQQLKVNNPTVPYANIDKTTYQYNYRGWLLSMTEPDAGRTEYMYRSDGKIRFSQNALQRERNRFSYTHYDELGRPIESGEYKGTTEVFNSTALKSKLEIASQVSWPNADITDWVKTYYDESHTVGALEGFNQTFLRGAVSASENANIKTWYSYDEQGRVKWMVQKPVALNRYFVVKYEYDFSGKVEKVEQFSKEGSTERDRFFHHYDYDADQRLSVAYTSTDGNNKTEHARYLYYLHGPLRRIELAKNLQGIDFVYNIHGWLESINHPENLKDPGADGQPGTNNKFKKDVFGLLLDYYDSEFGALYQGADAGFDLNKFHGLPNTEEEKPYTALAWFKPQQAFSAEPSSNLGQFSAENPSYRKQIADLKLRTVNLQQTDEVVQLVEATPDPQILTASILPTSMVTSEVVEEEAAILRIPTYSLVWKDLVGVTSTNGVLTKVAVGGWGNGGAASENVLPANTDGFIEFTAFTSHALMVGFSTTNADANYTTIQYAMYNTGGAAQVYISGSYIPGTNTPIVNGDILRVERVGTTIQFKKNGITFYTHNSVSSASMLVDVAISGANNSVGPVTSSFWIPSTPVPNPVYDVVWTDLVGVSVNGNSITKTAANGWGNGGAASVNQLAPNVDGWVEYTVDVANGQRMFGLSDQNADASFASIDYAWATAIPQILVYENGVLKGNYPGAVGDVLRVERVGSTIYYKKNGVIMRTVTGGLTTNLIADAAINESTYKISNAKASFWIPPAQGLAPDIWEFAALKELYDSLGGANWTNKTGWPAAGAWPASATPVQMDAWYGIDIQNGDISAISFINNNLVGKIPAKIGNLKGLRALVLAQHTNMIGSIPATIGNLPQLHTLNLSTNKLAGAIPASINQLTNLRTLHLGSNLFTGSLPALSALTNLTFLDLSGLPTLTPGPLPTWLGNFVKLETFYMYNSVRNGIIPIEMQNLVSLKYLNLAQNQLTGAFPVWMGNLTNLIQIYLHTNQLSGTIATDFSGLINLDLLILYSNQFTGLIPASLNAAPKIRVIQINGNQFSGEIPYLGDRSGTLTQLIMGSNPLTPGPIPDWIGNLTKLTHLSLDATNRTGVIPTTLSNLTELSQLQLQSNQLSGSFPNFLASLPKVAYLYIQGNQLTGTLPSDWSGTPLLYYLQCSNNKLTGAIPASLLNLPSLTIAYFASNDFTSMPNFSTKTNKASFLLRVDYNRIDFTTLEPNFTGTNTHPFSYFVFAPQKTINDVLEYSIPVNQQLEIPGRPVTGLNTVVWEKWNGSSWVNVNASNQNTTGTSYRRTNAVATDAGTYRFRITSSKVTTVTLQSESISVAIADAFNQTAAYLGNALYNGNITALAWRTDPAHASGSQEYKGMFIYRYDDKYQLQESQFANPNFVTNTYSLAENKFRENGMTYDPNGNLLTLKRYTESQHKVHDFTYNYEALTNTNLIANSEANSLTGYVSANGAGVTLSTETINSQTYAKTTVTQNVAVPGIRLAVVNVVAGEKYTFRVQGYKTSNGTAYLWVGANTGANLVWLSPTAQLASGSSGEDWIQSEFTIPAGVTSLSLGVLFNSGFAVGDAIFINRVELFKSQARSNRLASVSGYVNAYTYNAIGQMTVQDNVTGADMYVDYDVTGKVTQVYSDAAKTKLTTKYLYDDRGFRLTKQTYNSTGALQFTTWYIRDASGNVMSIYEQQAGQPTIALTEIPVYGSGKLGMARTKLDGSLEYIYEMTDHLGNVRATIKASDDVYLATMEDTGVADWTNPRVREMQHFKNLFETEKRDSRMNKTSPTVVANPERSAYLFWINDGVAATREDQVGPAIALQVDKGDSLSLETWAKFERKVSYNRNATTGMLADLLGSMFVNAAYGLETATQAKQVFNTNLSAALGGTGADPATRPYAYLNYLIFDNNYVVKDGGAWRVPDAAGFDPGLELAVNPQQVKFPSYIKPQQKGYIYIWVSNESENTKVWFDDLKVTHTKSRVVQASDYYAWGSTMREQRSPENPTYRYGYQGQFAEKDLETGWNHFELREYDGIAGRWTSTDPYGQYWSAYLGMGNNPVNEVDPDGGYSKMGAWIRNGFSMKGLTESGGEWGYKTYDSDQMITTFNFGKLTGGSPKSGLAPNPVDAVLDMLPGDRYNGVEGQVSLGPLNLALPGIKKGYEVTFNPGSLILAQAERSNLSNTTYIASTDDGVMRVQSEVAVAWHFNGVGIKRMIEFDDETGHMDGFYNKDISEATLTIRGFTFRLKWGSEGRSLFYGLKAGVGGAVFIGGSAEAWHGNIYKF